MAIKYRAVIIFPYCLFFCLYRTTCTVSVFWIGLISMENFSYITAAVSEWSPVFTILDYFVLLFIIKILCYLHYVLYAWWSCQRKWRVFRARFSSKTVLSIPVMAERFFNIHCCHFWAFWVVGLVFLRIWTFLTYNVHAVHALEIS